MIVQGDCGLFAFAGAVSCSMIILESERLTQFSARTKGFRRVRRQACTHAFGDKDLKRRHISKAAR